MKFWVATPAFNGMPALRRCIGSVRGQVAPRAQRPEGSDRRSDNLSSNIWSLSSESESSIRVHHHIQDGRSTDGGIEFLKEFDAEINDHQSKASSDFRPPASDFYPAYTFSYSSERDAGMYDAINKAWAKADGDILSWLNADEQYLPGTLAKAALYFEEHPDVDVVFGNMIIVDRNGRPFAARREIPFRPFYVKRDFLYTASCTLFFRRTLFERGMLNFDTGYRLAGDMDLILKLAANGVKLGHINDYLSLFGTDNNNLSVKYKARMEEEVQRIRRIYGGSNSSWVCKAAKMVRFTERAFCGCYRREDISFLYANNEQPEYRQIAEDGLGFRFTYELAQKKADRK
jgi:glycosyltransferase involved in cell wall biosynthesis